MRETVVDGECVFCRIVQGKEPASRVFEDGELLAFLSLRPTRPGEVLVIPKQHIDHFTDVPEPLAVRLMVCAHRLGRVIRRELHPLRVGIVVSGFTVPHVHVIVVPQEDANDITSGRFVQVERGEMRFTGAHLEQSRTELDGMAERLRAAIRSGASGT